MERQYKDSGIEWIGQIPTKWKVVPHKRIMHKIKKLCPKYNGEDIISLTMNGVVVRDLTTGGKMPTSFDGYQYVYPGNLLMCLFDIDVTPRCVGYIKNEGLTSPAYSQFELFEGAHGPYYDYLLRYMDDEKCILHLSKNLRSSLTEDDFGQILSIIPPYREQQRIADYLDKKCAEIDGLIELQEQMIAQLTDYKQSVITEAVTKGLNPNATLVPSDVDWIEHIPLGWEIKPFKEIFRTGKGLSFTKADLVNEGVPVISYGQVHSKQNSGTRIDDELIRFVPNEITNGGDTSKVYVGDFIFADTSEDLDGCGNCVYVDKEIGLYAGYHSVVAHSKRKKSNLYLAYLFLTNCWRSQIRCRVSGIKVFSISQSIIKQATIILPPVEEQIAIATYLNKKCTEIDNLIAAKQQKIEMLKEYKKSLIFECVTGKKEIN